MDSDFGDVGASLWWNDTYGVMIPYYMGSFMKDWGFKQIKKFIPDIYKDGYPRKNIISGIFQGSGLIQQ